jgi:hypothetical protein
MIWRKRVGFRACLVLLSMLTPQLIRQSTQDFPVGIDMRQRTFSYLYACYPLPSMIYQVSIKTSIYYIKCCISSK